MTLAKKILLGMSALTLVVVAGTAYMFIRAEPSYTGSAQIPGLSAKSEIFRDSYGVPHIFAANWNDAARALGYAHAGERFFQMEMQRRAGQGRLAEIIGVDMLDVDKFTRTLGLYRLAQTSFDAMSPDAQSYFAAYAEGVNAWLATHKDKLSPDFLLLHDVPEPWTPADSVVWSKLMALDLSHNYHLEILRAHLAAKLPAEQLKWLFPMPPAVAPVTTQPTLQRTSQNPDDKLAAFLGIDHAASNEWVIGGAHTQSGKPILANDPHLGLEAPILWYLARIVTPEGSIKGATVPGLPVVLLGQNDHVAWGFTTTGSDVEDLFIETLDPDHDGWYMTPYGREAFTERTETIHVKNAPDVILNVRATRHGPVMSDVSPDIASVGGEGKVVALAFTGLGARDLTAEALLHMNRARNSVGLLNALYLYQSPPQNIVYADDAGAFGFINPGLVPVRKAGDGLMPVEGASGKYDWDGVVPFDKLPQIANPEAGYVFNANNAVVGPNSPAYFGQDWEEPYRARRLQQFFDSGDKFTLDQSAAMQADHLSLVAKDFLPMLLAVTPQDNRAKQALDLLRWWDGVMDMNKPEPVIFEAWLYSFHNHMFGKSGVSMATKGPFAALTLMTLVKRYGQEWCDDEDCHAMIAQSLNDALEMMVERQGPDMKAWRWGRENVAVLTNKFYSHIPVFKKLSDLSIESSGDFYTLDRGGGFDNTIDNPFLRTHGGGFRGIYDLSNPDASRFMIATGESGHILSWHYRDFVTPWVNVKSITLSGSANELKEGGANELVLEP